MNPLVEKHFNFSYPLASESAARIKQSSPPGCVAMNSLRKVFCGLFGLPLSSLNAFGCYLQWRWTGHAARSRRRSAVALLFAVPPSLHLSTSPSCSEAGRNVNPHYLTG